LSKKNIGIIGIGDLTKEFFNRLIDSDVGQKIISQTEGFLFYDLRKSKEELIESEKYKSLEKVIDNSGNGELISLNPFLIKILWDSLLGIL